MLARPLPVLPPLPLALTLILTRMLPPLILPVRMLVDIRLTNLLPACFGVDINWSIWTIYTKERSKFRYEED